MTNNSRQSRTDLPKTSFGYGLAISPVGMLTFYNAVANNGTMVLPQQDYKSTVVLNPSIASAASLSVLRSMLEQTVQSGTGEAIHSDEVSIAGKSETAILVSNKNGYNNQEFAVSSCAYFPAQQPKYSCIVALFKPRNGSVSGGAMAGSVIRTIAENMSLKTGEK